MTSKDDRNRPGLAIDTAFDACTAALFDRADGRILAERREEIGTGHAERLPILVGDLLGDTGTAFYRLSSVAVTVGPGSFTGIRIGVAAARGYALALDIPALGVVTLEAMAEAVRMTRPILAIHDAKRGEMYAMLLAADGSRLIEPLAASVEMVAAHIRDLNIRTLDVTGSGADAFSQACGLSDVRVLCATSRIDIGALAALAVRSPSSGPPVPLYLRSADAKPSSRRFSLFAPAVRT